MKAIKPSVLVLAAHFDDEVLGCGGVIQYYTRRGIDVNVAIVASARKIDGNYSHELTQELMFNTMEVQKVLGIKQYYFGGLPDEELHTEFGEVRRYVERLRDELEPTIIYVQNPTDINQDHETLFKAAKIAFRVGSYKKPFELYTYEVSSSTDQGYAPFEPNTWFALTTDMVGVKEKAMECYPSQITIQRCPHAIGVRALARGLDAGVPYAEAFKLIQAKYPTHLL